LKPQGAGGIAGQPLHTLPLPTTVPPRSVQFSSCRFTFGPDEVMQSVSTEQAMATSLLHVPAGSSQTPVVS
jgi:hypothetical protein